MTSETEIREMSRQLLHKWLLSENRQRDEEAEALLFELFEHLPMPTPSQGFADRVLARAGIHDARPADLQGAWRYFTIAALLLTALPVAGSVPLVGGLLAGFDAAALIGFLTGGLTALIHLLADLWSLGEAIGSFGRALWLLMASPQALAVLCTMTVFILVVSRWLVALISSQRTPHAPI